MKLRKVYKPTARKAYDSGKTLMILPCKANPYSPWFSDMKFQKRINATTDFDIFCNTISFYHCNSELGKTLAYYIVEE